MQDRMSRRCYHSPVRAAAAAEKRDAVVKAAIEVLPKRSIAVVPAGTVHRTRAIGRTVNVTFEMQGARTEFVEMQG
jgi:hypothetical protein